MKTAMKPREVPHLGGTTRGRRILGIAAIVVSYPAWLLAFRLVVNQTCPLRSEGCYGGGDSGSPQVVAGVVFFGLLLTGLALLKSTTDPDRWPAALRVCGWSFLIAAIPIGVHASLSMVSVFCPYGGGCSGDYFVMAVAALMGAAALVAVLLVMGCAAVLRAHQLARRLGSRADLADGPDQPARPDRVDHPR